MEDKTVLLQPPERLLPGTPARLWRHIPKTQLPQVHRLLLLRGVRQRMGGRDKVQHIPRLQEQGRNAGPEAGQDPADLKCAEEPDSDAEGVQEEGDDG